MPAFARAVVYPDSEEKIINLVSGLTACDLPFKVIGGMTNLLIKDGIYHGVVIKTDKMSKESSTENVVSCSCGMRMSRIIRSMASLGFGGMEGLFGIPGTVGGMVKQNAGAFGNEIKDRFVSAVCYYPADGRITVFNRDDMRFAYRSSALSGGDAVLISATFDFVTMPKEDIDEKIKDFQAKRRENQPFEYPSLGSVFKRHSGQSAGYYIDRSGLKGVSVGGAEISEKHAGFIINRGGATAYDYLKLIDIAKEKVYADFGIELEEEIEII